jgi:tetratricopeptide (TPR) repeat protein
VLIVLNNARTRNRCARLCPARVPAQIRLGETFLEMGRLDDAQPLLDHAVRNVAPEGAPRFRAIALEALGELYRVRQHPEAAAPLIAEAQELRQALSANAR